MPVRVIAVAAGLGVQGDAHCGVTVTHRSRVGGRVVLRLTGLRNPCEQLDRFQPGLMAALVHRALDGRLVRKAGVMSVVVSGGEVRPGDEVRVTLPAEPHRALELA